MLGKEPIDVPESLSGQICPYQGGYSFSLVSYSYTAARATVLLSNIINSRRVSEEMPHGFSGSLVRMRSLIGKLADCFGDDTPKGMNGRIVATRLIDGIGEAEMTALEKLNRFQDFLQIMYRQRNLDEHELRLANDMLLFTRRLTQAADDETDYRLNMGLEDHDFILD